MINKISLKNIVNEGGDNIMILSKSDDLIIDKLNELIEVVNAIERGNIDTVNLCQHEYEDYAEDRTGQTPQMYIRCRKCGITKKII